MNINVSALTIGQLVPMLREVYDFISGNDLAVQARMASKLSQIQQGLGVILNNLNNKQGLEQQNEELAAKVRELTDKLAEVQTKPASPKHRETVIEVAAKEV